MSKKNGEVRKRRKRRESWREGIREAKGKVDRRKRGRRI